MLVYKIIAYLSLACASFNNFSCSSCFFKLLIESPEIAFKTCGDLIISISKKYNSSSYAKFPFNL